MIRRDPALASRLAQLYPKLISAEAGMRHSVGVRRYSRRAQRETATRLRPQFAYRLPVL
jgi:hypothetical protein